MGEQAVESRAAREKLDWLCLEFILIQVKYLLLKYLKQTAKVYLCFVNKLMIMHDLFMFT